MLLFAKKSIRAYIALMLVIMMVIFVPIFDYIDGYATDQTPPYITMLDSERVNVPERTDTIYSESGATVNGVPSSIDIKKVTNLKNAITSHKNDMLNNMSTYQNDYVISNDIIDNNVALVDSTNALIDNYKNDSSIVTATSYSDLVNKVRNSAGNIIIKMTSLDVNGDVTLGSSNKSVTLIVDSISFGNSNKSLNVYGNLIVFKSFSLKSTEINIKQTSLETDGNFLIVEPTSISSGIDFDVQNMLYFKNDFTINQYTRIQAGSLIADGNLKNTSNGTDINVTKTLYVDNDFVSANLTDITANDFIIKGDITNTAYNCVYDITDMFYVNNNVLISNQLDIDASYFIVNGGFTNTANSTTIDVTNTIYIYNDMNISNLLIIHSPILVCDGNISNSSYHTAFYISDMFYIENNLILSNNTIICSKKLFVGEIVSCNSWGQLFDVTNDVFFGSLKSTNQTTIRSSNGDLIVEGLLNTSSDLIVDVAGRIAVGGSILNSGYIYSIIAGGDTSSVILSDTEPGPTATPLPTFTAPPTPVDEEALLIKEAKVIPNASMGDKNYLLSITYRRLTGITEEHIIIEEQDAQHKLVLDLTKLPNDNDIIEDGYVTYNDIPFVTSATGVNLRVTGKTKTVTYPAGVGNADSKGKPYFTTDYNTRINLPGKISKIYMDHSAKATIYNSSVSTIDIKHLKKAIFDYTKYFRNVKNEITSDYMDDATIYYNKSIEQIEALIANNSSSNIIIKTDNLDLTKNTVLGSPTKSVTLIVDNLTVNTPRTFEIYGNLIVNNNFNANQALTIKTNKVNGSGGNFFTGNVNYNGYSTLNIASMLYANTLTLNQGGTLTADTIFTKGQLTVNANSQSSASKDIIADNFLCNQSANITATYGDLVVRSCLTVNSTTYITVGGRVSVGKRVIFNQAVNLSAGGQKSALILPDETVIAEPIEVIKEKSSKNINIILLLGAGYTTEINHVANFGNDPIFFAGDSIYYKADFPENASNITLSYCLNDVGLLNVFEPFSDDIYVMQVFNNGDIIGSLPSALSGFKLNITKFSITNGTTSFIIKTRLKKNISSSVIKNVIKNTLTLNYTNGDGTEVTIDKKFDTIIISTPSLRMN